MISNAIVAGSYKEAVSCMKFYNLPRETCIVILNDSIFRKCKNESKNWKFIFGDRCEKNTAYPLIQEELARRVSPELGDEVLFA